MRLKEDSSSYRSSAIVKRDFKHGNVPIPERISRRNHKDTRRWCRGKVGVEHTYVRYQRYHFSWHDDDYVDPFVNVKCTQCGKDGYKRRSRYSYLPFVPEVKYWCETGTVQVRLSDGTYTPAETYHQGHWD